MRDLQTLKRAIDDFEEELNDWRVSHRGHWTELPAITDHEYVVEALIRSLDKAYGVENAS